MHTTQDVPKQFSANDMSDDAPEYIDPLVLTEQAEVCISRESNPGHIDGNDVFYH